MFGISRTNYLILFLLALGFMSMTTVPCPALGQPEAIQLSSEEQAFLKQHPRIVIGIEQEWEPAAIVRKDGAVVGYDVDILARINQNTGANFTLQLGHWKDLLEKAKNREIDGLGGTSVSEQRKTYFNFSDRYCRLVRMVMVLKGNPLNIKRFGDLRDKRISIQKGNQFDEETVKRLPSATIIRTDTAAELISALIHGKADAAFGHGVYMYLAGKLGISTLQFAFAMDQELDIHFSLRNDWPLALSIMNKGLRGIPEDEYNRIYVKWLGAAPEKPFDYLLFIKIALPLALAGALFLVFYFRKINQQLLFAQKELKKDIYDRKKAQAELDWESRVNKAQADLGNALISLDQGIEDIAGKVLSSAQALTRSEYGFVAEIDRKNHDCRVYTQTSMFEDAGKSSQVVIFPRGKDGLYHGLWGHALNTGQAFYTNTPASHPQSNGLPQGHVPLNRFLSVPVKYGGAVTGLIALANPPQDFIDSHIGAVQQLADLYALAIQRNRDQEDGQLIETQLRQAHKMESLGTLAGGIAHDFNNILSAIIGYSELALWEVEADKNNAPSIRQIIKAGSRASDLVEQIMAFSRKMDPVLRPLDLNQVIRDTKKMLERTFPGMISIELLLSDDLWQIHADPGNMTQVLINLCANAKDAMPDGGRIVIETGNLILDSLTAARHAQAAPGRYVRLAVLDTGCGMDQETVECIFDPFFTSKEVGKGTGLGLSTVYGIITSHGGHIECSSTPGTGTTFNIYLPSMQSENSSEKLEKQKGGNIQGHAETILLVDDEVQIREIWNKQLTHWGYQVITAGSGEEALNIYQKNIDTIDLVILDISMPGMGGHKAMEKLLDLGTGIKIIISSGYSLTGSLKDVETKGAAGFISKPFSATDMLEKIREVLDS